MNITSTPHNQNFNIEGIKHISPEDACNAIENNEAYLLDVREPEETIRESVRLPNVILHPMSAIMDSLVNIPTDKMIITACPGGVRSVKVADLLVHQGFKNVVNLDGGLMTWKSKGLPFHTNILYAHGPGNQAGAPEIQKPWQNPSSVITRPVDKNPK